MDRICATALAVVWAVAIGERGKYRGDTRGRGATGELGGAAGGIRLQRGVPVFDDGRAGDRCEGKMLYATGNGEAVRGSGVDAIVGATWLTGNVGMALKV